jgi:hypothetical protein
MDVVLILTRIRIYPENIVRYRPNFADDHLNELARVVEVIDSSKEQLQRGPSGTPYWLSVCFLKDGFKMIQPTTRFILEERCHNTVSADA